MGGEWTHVRVVEQGTEVSLEGGERLQRLEHHVGGWTLGNRQGSNAQYNLETKPNAALLVKAVPKLTIPAPPVRPRQKSATPHNTPGHQQSTATAI